MTPKVHFIEIKITVATQCRKINGWWGRDQKQMAFIIAAWCEYKSSNIRTNALTDAQVGQRSPQY